MKELNLFQKINEIRDRILKLKLKKTGYNKFAGYYYYELADFLPQVIIIEKELGLTSNYDGFADFGELEVVNADNPSERKVYKISVKEANAKGMLEIQKAGAENTYGKRYAYQNDRNLTENDGVDGLNQKETTTTDKNPINEDERAAKIAEISDLLGNDESKVEQWFKHFEVTAQSIPLEVANNIIARIKAQQQNA